MEVTTSKEYPWSDLSESTLSPYYKPEDVISTYPTYQYWENTGERLTTSSSTKAGDTILLGDDYWMYNGQTWQVALRKENYTRDYVDNLCADYQKKLETKDKEIEELKKALEVLIGVRDGKA